MDPLKKRGTDYTDYAYREAVSKLRYLLAESYTTPYSKVTLGPRTVIRNVESEDERDSSLALQVASRRSVSVPPSKALDVRGRPPPELMSFIERQEEYIEQLEKESQYCREELSNMMGKVKEVISENEGLHERRKSGLLSSAFNSFDIDDDDDEDTTQEEKDEISRSSSKRRHLSGPKIVFESRISELEGQLTQTKMELRKALEEADSAKKKLGESLCNASQAILDTGTGSSVDLYRHIETLQREKEELSDSLGSLQTTIAQFREKEANATQKVKRAIDAVDQAQFEKNQVEQEMSRLKSELERMSEKQRESLHEQSRRVAEAERRYSQQADRLNADLTVQWDTATKLGLELDKQRRLEAELRREIAHKNAAIDDLKKELNTKTSSLASADVERESLEAELAATRLAVERAERAGRQEAGRLQDEVAALRQRLERADKDLLHSRKENLRLTDQLASLEKELNLSKLSTEEKESLGKDSKREKELTSMILDMDSKHVQSVAELEGMIQSQTQLMEKLKDECHSLTQKLEDSSARHKEEMAGIQSNIEYLNSKLEAPNYENEEWRDEAMVGDYAQPESQYELHSTMPTVQPDNT